MNSVLATRTGRPADSFSPMTTLLYGPLLRGTEVSAMSRNSVTAAAAVKLGIFTVASVLVTGLLTVIMGNIGFGDTTKYSAIFSTASQLQPGDDVRVAGVSVGEVKDVEVHQRSRALVTFTARTDVPMTTESRAEVRFLNLVGDRYLALVQGDPGAERLEPEATIPIENTTPALNLTVLFNGFQPLFAALDPKQVNALSMNIVRTLQGEGGTIRSLLASTASLTNSLADRDQLIGEVIDNLSTMLGTVDDRHQQLSRLVIAMRDWTTDLSADRKAIGSSIGNLSSLTAELAALVEEGRPLLEEDVRQLRELAGRLSAPQNEKVLREMLDRLPESLTDQTRTGTYGSWYNYYLCDVKGSITLPRAQGPRREAAPEGAQQPRLPQHGCEVQLMRGYTDRQIVRLGAITIVILLVVMAAAFNLSKFPGFGGSVYRAEFTDASGLREGNMVQIAGMRAGRVEDIELAGDKVVVEFRVDDGYEFGTESAARCRCSTCWGRSTSSSGRQAMASSTPRTPSRWPAPTPPTTSSACSAT